jgi:uncharacterized membrane protein
MKLKQITWIIIVLLSIFIGLYPFSYVAFNVIEGFLQFKGEVFEANNVWYLAFYTHILLGGIPLLTGWSQFSNKFRNKHIELHRAIGKIYVVAVLISAIAGFYLAVHANGGIVAKIGFSGMSISWLITTILAYSTIRNGNIEKHKQWMIRSFAVTLTGVTFRLWAPILFILFESNPIIAYRIDSWISWALNLVIAEVLITRLPVFLSAKYRIFNMFLKSSGT